VGIGLRRAAGVTHFGTSFSYSHFDSDVTRKGAVVDPFEATMDNRDLHILTAITGGSHRFDFDRTYFRLGLDLGVDYLIAEDGNESGAGALNLQLDDYEEPHVWTRPGLEVGYRAPLRSTLELHVYTAVGLQYYLTDPYTDVVADFEGAPAGASSMRVPVSLGQSEFVGAVGVELMAGKTWSLGVQYNMGFADHLNSDSFGFGFTARW
jgi:hypothetical protein